MKKYAFIATLVAILAVPHTAFAGGGGDCHFHGNTPVKEAVLVGCAAKYKDGLVSKGKIDPSWKGIKIDKAETIDGKSMKEWKFTFKNPAEKDATKGTLYMFYTLTGNFIAVNFSGK
jgi:hypothetical protein